MNILLINHYAGYPNLGMEYRPYYLSKECGFSFNTPKSTEALL